jgi:hypothetical protein
MDLTSAIPAGQEYLTAREAQWVQRRCARRGHVLAHLADPEISALTGPITLTGSGGSLLRCLRCGAWVDPDAVGIAEVVGSAQAPCWPSSSGSFLPSDPSGTNLASTSPALPS